jgi:hypothetical protein
MKKVYLMALAALFGSASMAQVSVTFQVDMNGETVSANGVHAAGNWQEEAGFSADWQPGESMMTDDDSDGIYELTVDLPAGSYQFKFINGSDWNPDGTNLGNEGVPGEVAIDGNRFFTVTDWHADLLNQPDGFVLPAIPYNGTAPAGKVAVRLNVNMSNETTSEAGVHVAGTIIEPNWTPEYGSCTPFGLNEWGYVTYVDADATYEYKFVNGTTFGIDPDESISGDCGPGNGNRELAVGSSVIATESFCFGSCETCSDPNVTFTVDLSNEDVDNGGFLAGSFNGFSGQAMNDNGDGTYTLALALGEGTYEFKFQNGLGGWEAVPGDCAVNGNRELVVGPDPVTVSACINQCNEVCVPNPDPANITFQVDMNAETVAAEGVFLIGSFTDPVFQAGALTLTDDNSDGIYEVTVEVSGSPDLQYKYVNGDVNVVENEESADFETLGCGTSNGIGGWNRTHTRTGVDEVIPVVPFNSCGVLNTAELDLGSVSIFPNPSNGVSYIDVPNPNGYTLRMNIVDITGKTVRENAVLNTTRYEINTTDLNPGLYFLNIVNERSETAVYKLMVQ